MTAGNRTIAIVREAGPSLAGAQVTFLDRRPIDAELARGQHRSYCDLLGRLGARVVALPYEPAWPDSAFVEDTAVVVDEVAVTTLPGSPARRPEVLSVADTLARYRPVEFMRGPGTLDGGDVLRLGRTLYVGHSRRTTPEGAAELRSILAPFGYDVRDLRVTGSLHLKTACTSLGRGAVIANRTWFDSDGLSVSEMVDVPDEEPWAANVLLVGETVVVPSGFPRTLALLDARGFTVEAVDVSEFQKAEAGLTCMSVLVPPAESPVGVTPVG